MPKPLQSWSYVRQENEWSCSRAVFESLAKHYGLNLNQKDLFLPDPETGITTKDFEKILKRYFEIKVKCPGKIYQIQEAIRDGFRVVICFLISEYPPDTASGEYNLRLFRDTAEGHFATVTGFHNGKLIIDDPYLGPQLKMPVSNLNDRWQGSFEEAQRWMAVVKGVRSNIKKARDK